MQQRRRKKPEQDAKEHILAGKDKPFIEKRYINAFKGRGVFAIENIEPSTFVVEYCGILSESKEVEDDQGTYLFDFKWNGKHYCIDASKEDGKLGQLVNGDHRTPNCKVKTIVVEGRPHLCLFSTRKILKDEEITYHYGDSSWPWHSMEMCNEALGTQNIEKPCSSETEKGS
ncbi:histone-lysine N-methyltransferase set-1-like [Thalassophryne amazonica]|uniref:histone-lysine N-methyltransferase set-1-like n=1 Tax=Thalassophryne amazonica TaxID=390379 RepID=UPI0014719209|nr:histone-lysine N-methyltransferase set-1-like [Thalassophryne amazonica]